MRVQLVEYGVGNTWSIVRACQRLNIGCEIVTHAKDISGTTPLILGGVGRFDDAMRRLAGSGMKARIMHHAAADALPVLGICLGMQLLSQGSEEGHCEGMGLLPGTTLRFDFGRQGSAIRLPVPHMGWNTVRSAPASGPAIMPEGGEAEYYFNHAYHLDGVGDARVATTAYGYTFPTAVQQGNIFGVQFHPEKSRRQGAELLLRFAQCSPGSL